MGHILKLEIRNDWPFLLKIGTAMISRLLDPLHIIIKQECTGYTKIEHKPMYSALQSQLPFTQKNELGYELAIT